MTMKAFLMTVVACICLLPVQAQSGTAEQILGGLLSVGAELLQTDKTKTPDAEKSTSQAQEEQSGGFFKSIRDSLPSGSDIKEVMYSSAKEALKPLVDEYKAEGREYAAELGDMLAEKVLNSPKVQETLFSVRALCWGVVGYLTLITILMMVMLGRVMRQNSRVLAAIEAMQKKIAD